MKRIFFLSGPSLLEQGDAGQSQEELVEASLAQLSYLKEIMKAMCPAACGNTKVGIVRLEKVNADRNLVTTRLF